MKLLVLGGTGGVGEHLLPLAVAAGHEVTTLARASSTLAAPEGVRVLRGDVMDRATLEAALAGSEAVLSALGMRRRNPANPWSPLTSPADFNSASARVLVAAMQAAGVRRLVAVSAAGVAESAAQLNWVMRFFVAKSNVGVAYRDLAVMEQVLAESGLDWVAPRPTRLTRGPKTGRVKVVRSFGAMDAISRADVADWMVRALAEPGWPAAAWGGRTPQITSA
jgi:putative NADH-flavin reductase